MQPKSYPDVSIVIMDLKGFTEMSSTMAANDLVRTPTRILHIGRDQYKHVGRDQYTQYIQDVTSKNVRTRWY